MKLEREERRSLHEALMQIFMRADEIELFTQLELDEPIGNITDDAPIPVMLLRVIQHVESRGSIESLIDAALRRVGQNGEAAAALQTVRDAVRARQQTTSTLRRMPPMEEIYDRLLQLERLIAEGGTRAGAPAPDVGSLLSLGRQAATAVQKLRTSGKGNELTKEEEESLQGAILLTSRPALLVNDGHFAPPPDSWRALELQRSRIEPTLANAGRIEIEGHPYLDFVGTGFVIDGGMALTVNYIASELTGVNDADGTPRPIASGRRAWLNCNETPGTSTGRLAIESVTVAPGVNVALLRLSGDGEPPGGVVRPLTVAASPRLDDGRKIYLVSYPAYDSRRDPAVMARVFGDVFGVKRLQAGTIVHAEPLIVRHDCSTLGGSGGAPVIDLETQLVLGIHHSARTFGAGEATRLDVGPTAAFLKTAGVLFA